MVQQTTTERQRARMRTRPAYVEKVRGDILDVLAFAPGGEMRSVALRKKVPSDPGTFYAVLRAMVDVGELVREQREKGAAWYRIRDDGVEIRVCACGRVQVT